MVLIAPVGILALVSPLLGLAEGTYMSMSREPKLYKSSVDSPTPTEVDVVVVGGGFSGVMAAYNTTQAGYKTVLLEARHRIGGRSQTQELQSAPGVVIELGATWINRKTQPHVHALCEEFGLETAEQYIKGDVIRQDHGGCIYRESQYESGESDAVNKFYEIVGVAAEGVDIRDFSQFPKEEDVSLAEWVAQHGLWDDRAVQAACENLCSALVGRMPHEVGAHYFLDYVKSGNGLQSLVTENENGAQSLKVKNGTSAITDALASTLPEGSVKLNSPVDSITQDDDGGVLVTTSSGLKYKAKKVIIAIPTNTYSRIRFTPSLPFAKKALSTSTMPGIYAKLILSYGAPWWRSAGLVGKFSSPVGPICFSWDTSDLDAKQYSLAIFVAGDIAAKWHRKNDQEREEVIIENLATLVGPELASQARNVLEVNAVEWTKEEHLWGAPTSSIGPGMLREFGATLREPFGNVHFGGGETAYEWKGYLEGAITSGQRAAKEVVESLRSSD